MGNLIVLFNGTHKILHVRFVRIISRPWSKFLQRKFLREPFLGGDIVLLRIVPKDYSRKIRTCKNLVPHGMHLTFYKVYSKMCYGCGAVRLFFRNGKNLEYNWLKLFLKPAFLTP